ncbi:MAG: acyl-CoA synthetase [Hydrogenophaga sp.]|uniref:LpxL/LpxP family acyltransferase n=1 Tax=Hydrogenophaga sp. TaxID=1904254 RepID=UPI001D462586|nr:acyl-CoA synthetase [Hydrogenophaga sp.]MBX3609931.1 acyl-CoA synthetase [Hydrogenophaga sp.]
MTAPKAPAWRAQPERGHQLVMRLMVLISLILGRRLSRCVLHGITLYFLLFGASARRASREYLSRVLGGPVRWRDLYRHLLAFATTVHDRVYLLKDRFDLFDIEIEGSEALLDAMADGRGVLLMGAHLGSFEALRCVGRRHPGISVSMLMYEDNARKVNAALQVINPALQQEVVPLGRPDSMIEAAARLEQGHLLGLLADRSLHNDARATHDFLGAPAPFPTAPWRLAAVFKRPVFFMAGLYMGGNRYRLVFRPLGNFAAVPRLERDKAIDGIRQAYVQALQACCRQAPMNWFNFFDFWRA